MTLLEVILAIGIFSVVVGGIYMTVQASMTTANEIRLTQGRANQVQSLLDILRDTFLTLPVKARFYTEESSGSGGLAFVLKDSPSSFTFGASGAIYGNKLLLLDKQEASGSTALELWIESPKEDLRVRFRDSTQQLVLLDDVTAVRWRFYDSKAQEWIEEWPENPNQNPPPLVELSLELADDPVPVTSVFWIPHGQ